jgi:hypothetical protein
LKAQVRTVLPCSAKSSTVGLGKLRAVSTVNLTKLGTLSLRAIAGCSFAKPLMPTASPGGAGNVEPLLAYLYRPVTPFLDLCLAWSSKASVRLKVLRETGPPCAVSIGRPLLGFATAASPYRPYFGYGSVSELPKPTVCR